MKPLAEQTLYEILEVPFDAADGEILRACERVQALFGPGSIATYSLIDPDEVKVLGERIEEARAVLLDPASRADYDDRITAPPPGLFPAKAPSPAPVAPAPPPAAAEVAAPGAAEPAAEAAPAPLEVAPPLDEVAPAPLEVAPPPAEVAPAPLEVASPPAEVAPPLPEVAPEPAAALAEASAPAPGQAAPPAPQVLVKRRRRKLPPVIRPLASPKPLPPPAPLDGAPVPPAPAPAASQEAEPEPTPSPIPLERVATPIPLATPVVPIPLATPVPIPLATAVPMPLATPVPISPPFAAIAAPLPAPAPAFAAPPPPPDPARGPRPPDRDIFLHEGTRFTGEVLRRAREARGLTVAQLCERTKITRHHIEHLEADRYDKLPAVVYLRGILVAVSKELRLDGQKVAKSYLEALAAAAAAPLTTPRR